MSKLVMDLNVGGDRGTTQLVKRFETKQLQHLGHLARVEGPM